MIRVLLTDKFLANRNIEYDANGWYVGSAGELTINYRDPQTKITEGIITYAPGQWQTVQDTELMDSRHQEAEPPNG